MYNKIMLNETEIDNIKKDYYKKKRGIQFLRDGYRNKNCFNFSEEIVPTMEEQVELENEGESKMIKFEDGSVVKRDAEITGFDKIKGPDVDPTQVYHNLIKKIIPSNLKNNFEII